jgi:hypothetical protein
VILFEERLGIEKRVTNGRRVDEWGVRGEV